MKIFRSGSRTSVHRYRGAHTPSYERQSQTPLSTPLDEEDESFWALEDNNDLRDLMLGYNIIGGSGRWC